MYGFIMGTYEHGEYGSNGRGNAQLKHVLRERRPHDIIFRKVEHCTAKFVPAVGWGACGPCGMTLTCYGSFLDVHN